MPARTGRPTKFKNDILKDVQKLAEVFCATDEDVAHYLKVHPDTIRRWKKKNPEFFWALEKGKAGAKSSLQSSLFRLGLKGNLGAIIFILTNRWPDQWRDRRNLVNVDASKHDHYTYKWSEKPQGDNNPLLPAGVPERNT